MFLGIDIGSTTTKIIGINEDIEYRKIIPTIEFIYSDEKENFLDSVSTGYGRYTIKSKVAIPEIRAHVIGAVYQTNLENFVLLDIGGQDFKIINVKNGILDDFVTNDKCAAGTGRFLEKMANVLNVDMKDLSQNYEDPVKINSTCTVFAETELVGLMMEKYPKERLMAGINYAVFERIRPYILRFRPKQIVFTGGVANNRAISKIIEENIGVDVIIPEDPQANGAIGCAIYSKKLHQRSML
ncbi:MAG: acyl-CoA dehydratase activase [Thermoplasmata archaeon]|jgi:predicted CoA-substrate-specific enzyme activase